MEEEDAILGLAPASLPVQPEAEVEMTLPSLSGVGGLEEGASAWSFEKALQATGNTHGNDGDNNNEADSNEEQADDDDDDSDGEDGDSDAEANDGSGNGVHASEEVLFREGDDAAAAATTTTASSRHVVQSSNHGGMDDDALLRISDKKEAKRLGKKLYKRWKKLNKKAKKHKSHKSSKKEKKSSSKEKKKKKSSEKQESDPDIDELGLVPAATMADAAAAIEARTRKAAVREAKMRAEKATRKSSQAKSTSAEVINIAKELVAAMAKARQMDDDVVHGRNTQPGVFPLHRVALKELVQARCRQAFMEGPLVEAGILQELSYWLYDVDRAEPAPYELRTTALDILLSLHLEGSIPMTDDLTQFMGVSREHLIKTDLGRALNALRKYSDETVENRGKCVQLLASFSRVISGTAERDHADENKSKTVWKCQRDPTVASPFEVLETRSEALQKAFLKPDPRDPTSYNGLLPWRPPATTITNVSGTLSDYINGDLKSTR